MAPISIPAEMDNKDFLRKVPRPRAPRAAQLHARAAPRLENHPRRAAQRRAPPIPPLARARSRPPRRHVCTPSAPQTAIEHRLESKTLPSGVKELTMHIGDHTYPVYLGYNKLPELVAELKKLDLDKVRGRDTRAARRRWACCGVLPGHPHGAGGRGLGSEPG